MGYRELGLQYSGSYLEEPVDKEARLVCMSTGTVAGCRRFGTKLDSHGVTKEKAGFLVVHVVGPDGWRNPKPISFDQLRFQLEVYANFQPEYCVITVLPRFFLMINHHGLRVLDYYWTVYRSYN